MGNCIDFANYILKNKKRNVGEARLHYNLITYKKMREYKILEGISENVTLVPLMDSLVNVNHAISVVGNWIFDSNYEFQNDAPILKYCQKSLNSCCFSSLASAFASINNNNAANAISLRIK